MEASGVYPNWPPVLTATGLGGSLAGSDPDQITFEPDLTNDARKRYSGRGGAVDVSGVMRLHVRNAQGYAYLRPHQRQKLAPFSVQEKRAIEDKISAEATYYRRTYRHHVPHGLLSDYLMDESAPQEERSKWQGNAIAGVDCGQNGHVVFYPTGQVLQQACTWYSQGGVESGAGYRSTVIETGAGIRQLAVMGCVDAYHSGSASNVYAAARGVTNCTIVAAPAQVTPDKPVKMQAKAKLSFPETLSHVTGSPHAEAELAFVTIDGVVRSWEPESGVQTVHKGAARTIDRFVLCEYSSHPRVLWGVKKFMIATIDLRQPLQQTNTVFGRENAVEAPVIYDVKRRTSQPFQFIVGSEISIELMDSRMEKKPLISWSQPKFFPGAAKKAGKPQEPKATLSAIDEVDLSGNANDNRGYIVSCFQRHKVTTIFSFERNRKRRHNEVMSLASLRSNADDDYSEVKRSSVEQIVASDAPLDLHMGDGGEWTSLQGICALRDGNSGSASIYHLNNLGDLFSHQVSYSCGTAVRSYHAAVQSNLRCGVSGQDDPLDDSLSRTLPLPVDAILPEHDMDTLVAFKPVPVKTLRRQFPRLPDDNDSDASIKDEDGESEHMENPSCRKRSRRFDRHVMLQKLLKVCDPSAPLYRLHRYVTDELHIQMSSSELLRFLRSHQEFRLRSVGSPSPADTLRVLTPVTSDRDNIHVKKDDPRLAVCICSQDASIPCESMSCIVPHSIVVSSTSTELRFDEMGASTSHLVMPDDFAAALEEAREAYDSSYNEF